MPRADRIAVNHPVVLTANSVQTKKKPPELLITPPFEWAMIIAAPISMTLCFIGVNGVAGVTYW